MKVVSFSNPTPVEKMKSFPFKKKEWPDDGKKRCLAETFTGQDNGFKIV